jgi:hypothetical protein
MLDFDALRIEKADEARICEIFGWMGKQFAQGEIKPLEMILRMVHDGYYSVYALLFGDELAAYALMVHAKEKMSVCWTISRCFHTCKTKELAAFF